MLSALIRALRALAARLAAARPPQQPSTPAADPQLPGQPLGQPVDVVEPDVEQARPAAPAPAPIEAPAVHLAPAWDLSLPLPPTQYVDEPQEKTLIVLHHTVGGSMASSVGWWLANKERVGTAIGLERDGRRFLHFPLEHWAWALGPGANGGAANNYEHDRRAIQIELASEGPLLKVDNGIVTVFKNPKTGRYKPATEPHVDLGREWRGYRYFDAYNPKQIETCIATVRELLDRFPSVPRRMPRDPWAFNADLRTFKGVLGHAHVRSDKSDVHPLFPWEELAEACDLELVG
ncbi:MAG TPA: N-acetylmuramoyl-L-alanine amidase [Anaeromyxobacteraceae bacterium]|nr:N-acetylmuramoyl-L-alanine amidase [Anaeromyxobacteraceae bacterium]